MFWKRITLFRLLGFTVRIDLSWFFIALLITWSLAVGLFPKMYEGLAPATYWWMGIAGALGLFASIIFHEFSHSLVARRYDIPIEGITLFIFGGVAEMTKEPGTPKAEFLMAIAGPIASFVLSGAFLTLHLISELSGWPIPTQGVLRYLGWINGVLALFNLVPAFPLDGGRVLRATLWQRSGDLRGATRIASRMGSGFGLAFMIAGGFLFISGNLIGGIWWFLIGQFMRTASMTSYQHVLLQSILKNEPVTRFMRRDPICVPASTSVGDLVENYFYRHHHKLFPVTARDTVIGQVGLADVKKISKSEWGRATVEEIAEPLSPDNTVRTDEDAMEALSRMRKESRSRLLVISPSGQLEGILTLKDLLELFALKFDLEGNDK